MLTATSESAVKALVFLAISSSESPVSPREIAKAIEGSPTYTAKITGLLVKAGILRSHRGVAGGVTLARSPESIALLDIVQACQGLLIANYCQELGPATVRQACAFHQAMLDVHSATVDAMSRWNLAMLAAKPSPSESLSDNVHCRMLGVAASCAKRAPSAQPHRSSSQKRRKAASRTSPRGARLQTKRAK
jgi:Rrf2 family protein